MKKDFIRDYATEAFRLYAAMGQPTRNAAAEQIYQAALQSCEFKDPKVAVICAENAVKAAAPVLDDISAAEKTIKILEQAEKTHIVRAVTDVYFARPTEPLRRGDVSYRANKCALSIPASEQSVYRWLKEARLLFAATRGLRLPNEKEKAEGF